MKIIADLHIHSKYSRATSKEISIFTLEKYAKLKGLNLLGTGDFTHPTWLRTLKEELTEDGSGILKTKDGFNFMLQTEVSNIYTQDNKVRKIHNLIYVKSFEIAEHVNELLSKKGNLLADGRPMFGKYPCYELVEDLKNIDKDIEIVPAHCLLPDELVYVNNDIKEIKKLKENEKVLTHKGRFKEIKKIYTREYRGEVLKIIPSCLKESTNLTPEHPIYAIKSYKSCKNMPHTICKPTCAYLKRGCKHKKFEEYKPAWIQAKDIEVGDIILYPRYNKVKDKNYIYLNKLLPGFFVDGGYIKPKKYSAGTKNIPIRNKIEISKEFCRLVGYYLSEGHISRDKVSFTFNKNEKEYIEDVKRLMFNIFGEHIRIYNEKEKSKGISFSIHSKILYNFFRLFYSSNSYRAFNKKIHDWMVYLPQEKQKEILIGWWRGDTGYTTSRTLAHQMKAVFLRLGVIPSITKIPYKEIISRRLKKPCIIDGRNISANRDCYHFHNLSFFGENVDLLEYPEFKKFKTKLKRRRGWIDKNFTYLPVIKVEKKQFKGKVYNLEVSEDNSYVTEALAVHNCWTPWFSLFGSNSGFNSAQECFKEQTKHIHALETGLSSDPEMNWRLSALDKFSLVSNSDAHSFWPWRIGRECNIFDTKMTYHDIINAIKTRKGFTMTVEVDPNYGKYHFDGHRNCNVFMDPKQSIKNKNICPACRRKLTIGVLHRVEELADRPQGFKPKNAVPFKKIIPLSEIISRVLKTGLATQKVWKEYHNLVNNFGSEFNVLLEEPFEKLVRITNEKMANAIVNIRNSKIKIQPGYDGEYGYPVFDEKDIKEMRVKKEQKGLGDFF